MINFPKNHLKYVEDLKAYNKQLDEEIKGLYKIRDLNLDVISMVEAREEEWEGALTEALVNFEGVRWLVQPCHVFRAQRAMKDVSDAQDFSDRLKIENIPFDVVYPQDHPNFVSKINNTIEETPIDE